MNISVIVPVYNIEKYVSYCIDSILAQTYKDFELILVDDGSKDGSGKICDEYAKKDSRIRVIHKENGGISSARNAGLDTAEGKYIMFVDGDDIVSKDILSVLLGMIEEQEDAIYSECGVQYIYSYSYSFSSEEKFEESIINTEEAIEKTMKREAVGLSSKLYRNNKIRELRFDESLRCGEDAVFYFTLYLNVKGNIIITRKKLYGYYQRDDSLCHTRKSNDYLNYMSEIRKIYYAIDEKMPELKKYSEYDIFALKILIMSQIVRENEYHEKKEIFEKFRKEVLSEKTPELAQRNARMKKAFLKLGYMPFAAGIKIYDALLQKKPRR